jgi:hypothetical protein
MEHSTTCVADILAAHLDLVTADGVPGEIEPCRQPPVTMVQLRVHVVPGIVSSFLAELCADHTTFVRLSRYFVSANPINRYAT